MIRSLLTAKWLIKLTAQCRSHPGPNSSYIPSRKIHFSCRNLQSTDYYGILGLKKTATQREIKAAYYQLSKKYHPDVAGSNASAAAKFLEISEAYECLRDPEKRRSYDNGMFGGGGRYTGDYSDPFQFYQQSYRQTYQRQSGNSFHNRQFTQAEYERIWKEFNRLRNQRETYDQRMEFERQRLWLEFAKKRAERWQAFHQKYPNGPPGSVKWEFRWGNNAGNQERRMYTGWELIRRIVVVYFVCFLFVSFVQVFFQLFDTNKPRRNVKIEEISDKDKIEAMMAERPTPSIDDYMFQQPSQPLRPTQETKNVSPVPSEAIWPSSDVEITESDSNGPTFS